MTFKVYFRSFYSNHSGDSSSHMYSGKLNAPFPKGKVIKIFHFISLISLECVRMENLILECKLSVLGNSIIEGNENSQILVTKISFLHFVISSRLLSKNTKKLTFTGTSLMEYMNQHNYSIYLKKIYKCNLNTN